MAPSKRKGKATENTSPTKVPPPQPEPESDGDESIEIEADSDDIPVKVNNGSLIELKNALDDATKLFLTKERSFSEDHAHDDVKLTVGWISCIMAGGISLAGWHFGWEKSQPYTAYVVGIYAVLSAILTAYMIMFQKQIIYIGTRGDKSAPERITISTEISAFDPIYKLSVDYELPKKNGTKKYQATLEPHFKEFFDVDGTLYEAGWHAYLDRIIKTAATKA